MLEFRLVQNPAWFNDFGLQIFDRENKFIGKELVLEKAEEGYRLPYVVEQINKQQLINLIDQLWNIGIRPSNGAGDANAMEAIKYHLEDFRRLVFKEKK